LLKLYNTLNRQVEELEPLQPGTFTMYTCGPTVYRDVHIGNLRSFLMADWIRRALEALGNNVVHVKNITDVGHMRQEMLEQGEDKVIAAALAEGKTPQQIAEFYTDAFMADEAKLGIKPAHFFPRATHHIQEMIAMIERLLHKGYAYEAGGNIYFDVTRFPGYGKLSGNVFEGLLEGVRVEADPAKRNQWDFTLWKSTEPGRVLKWPSPWGEGFPGWHIECSAMSTKYLGEQLDIHTGGVDNIFPHHEGEIAQSEGAFDKPFVRHWVHGQHLLADGLKMAKSEGNAYTIRDLEDRGFDPLSLRYLFLTVHYRNRLNFTFSALRAAQTALRRLRSRLELWQREDTGRRDEEAERQCMERFWDVVGQDLNLPNALTVLWDMASSTVPPSSKLRLVMDMDQVLGLDLVGALQRSRFVPEPVVALASTREDFRQKRDYAEADALRGEIANASFSVRDTTHGPWIRVSEPHDKLVGFISSPRDVHSYLDRGDAYEFSVNILARDPLQDVKRCVESVLKWRGGHTVEVIVVDNACEAETRMWLNEICEQEPSVRVLHVDHPLGEGAGRNVALKLSLGSYIIALDPSVEVEGDVFTHLRQMLRENSVGLIGRWGVCTQDIRQFVESPGPQVDAVESYCMAFRRALLKELGLMNEKYRFYRNLDLEFSFLFKDKGYQVRAIPELPLTRHEHRVWESLSPQERERLSLKNFRVFLHRWGHRTDLLAANAGGRPDH